LAKEVRGKEKKKISQVDWLRRPACIESPKEKFQKAKEFKQTFTFKPKITPYTKEKTTETKKDKDE